MQRINLPKYLFKFGKGVPLAIILALLIVGTALALTLANADGIWSNASGDGGTPSCLVYNNTPDTSDENQVRYGDNDQYYGCPSNTNLQSGFGFDGAEGLAVTPGEVFLLGEFTHYNRPIVVYNNFTQVDLAIGLDFTDPAINTTLDYTVQLDETTNEAPCAYPGSTICPDKVDLSDTIPDQLFGPIEGKYYKLQIVGFAPGTVDSCEYVPGETINVFYTEENQENNACLFARMLVEEPAIHIEKTPDVQYVSTGGDVVFTIEVSNVGNVDLENVVVTDALVPACDQSGAWSGSNLIIGASATYTCTASTITSDFTNVAVVTGNKVGDLTKTVSDDDGAVVTVQNSDITIIKDVVDDDLVDGWHSRDFDFATSYIGSEIASSFALDDDCDPVTHGCGYAIGGDGGVADNVLKEQITFSDLLEGVYTITETVPDGTRWILAPQGGPIDGIACTAVPIIGEDPVTPDVAIINVSPYKSGSVAISLAANQHVTCTFTNKPDPENTAVTLSDMDARARSDFTLAGLALSMGMVLVVGAVITHKRRSI